MPLKALVPVDGTRNSDAVLRTAAAYAAAVGARIHLLTVVQNITDLDFEIPPAEREKLLDGMRKRGESILLESVEFMKSTGIKGINLRSVLVSSASAADGIIGYAEDENFDMIIIGTRGADDPAKYILGSVAEMVVRYSPCSVLVVKGAGPF